ncbi:unnamed protein product [Rotaria magnacalcarata]
MHQDYNQDPPPLDTVARIVNIFHEDTIGQEFFDTVLDLFTTFDRTNHFQDRAMFANDRTHILNSILCSFTAADTLPKIQDRIDSYFYICCRIDEYDIRVRPYYQLWSATGHNKELRQALHNFLVQIFVETKGAKPNLHINDKNQLKKMDIREHLVNITTINNEDTLLTFLVLCKLSFQSSMIVDDNQHRLRWIDVVSKLKFSQLTLQQIITTYIDYKEAFNEFTFDIPALIHLITIAHPLPNANYSPFSTFMHLVQNLSLSSEMFYEQFLDIFTLRIRNQYYYFHHVGDLLRALKSRETLFGKYFQVYSTWINEDEVWKMFLYLFENTDLSEMVQNHLVLNLAKRFPTADIDKFYHDIKSAQNRLETITSVHRESYVKVLEAIISAFVDKHRYNTRYCYPLTEQQLKQFFRLALSLSLTYNLKQPPYSLIIERLVFKTGAQSHNKIQKMQLLFEKLIDFDQNLPPTIDPALAIRDEWLSDYSLNISTEWSERLTSNVYHKLCNSHQNNRLTKYVWSKIAYLALLKSSSDNINHILVSIDKWLQNIHLDANNILTIIFVTNVFVTIIVKYKKNVFLLPNVEKIFDCILNIHQQDLFTTDRKQVDEVIENGKQFIEDIFLLKGTCANYRALLNPSIIRYFLRFMDMGKISKFSNREQYKFPTTILNIDTIVGIEKPKDIDTSVINPIEQFFDRFIRQVNEWLTWFHRFFNIFHYIVEWLKTCNAIGAADIFNGINTIRDDDTVNCIQIKGVLENTLRLLKPFGNHLRRICYLFNCSNPIQIIVRGGTDNQKDSSDFIREMKRSQSKNTFTVNNQSSIEKIFPISDRQRIQWFLTSEKYPCNVHVEYRQHDVTACGELIFSKENISIHKHVLHGEFETQRGGRFIITIDNQNAASPRTIWFQIKSTSLAICHLFQGIFNIFYQRYFAHATQPIRETQLNDTLDQVFQFIDSLLNGTIKLRDMVNLKTVFYNKNINVREEVERLFTNRLTTKGTPRESRVTVVDGPGQNDIEQVCKWLKIYQYYCHINSIVDCIRQFDIIPIDHEDESIGHLKRLSSNENISLREISQAYKILLEQFTTLGSEHLHLIKISVECSAVVNMMKKADLYSPQGQHRFQELRDNLTTQFQFQERNSMILNSLIITYVLCEPFITKAKTLEEFVGRLSQLRSFEESSLKHMRVINENIQTVNMWLSTEETSTLDNALVTMEHIYKTGIITIRLGRLINKPSYFQIEYSIVKMRASIDIDNLDAEVEQEDRPQDLKRTKFVLSMADINDHKRQLTFCNVDLPSNMSHKKVLLSEQLRLLEIVEKIYSMFVKLEIAGHPDCQLRDKQYEIYDRTGKISSLLSKIRDNQNITDQQLQEAIRVRTDHLQLTYRTLETNYAIWLGNLERFREENSTLKLFSNRQIMIMIILLSTENLIKCHFLRELYSSIDINNQNANELKLTLQLLSHYLHSLRASNSSLSKDTVSQIYARYKIGKDASAEMCLQQLCSFMQAFIDTKEELTRHNSTENENQQYLVALTPMEETPLKLDLDMDTCCILFNLFQSQLPSFHQILWCSTTTEEDIHLFFSRVQTFQDSTFVVMNIDKMHHRLRELLLNEHDSLTRLKEPHGVIYYVARGSIMNRKNLRPFQLDFNHRDPHQAYTHFLTLCQQNSSSVQPQLEIICGAAGIGKTHHINRNYKNDDTITFSVNDRLNVSSLVSSLLLYDSRTINDHPTVYFNISIHAPFEELNRAFFSLFVCGSLTDVDSGLTFSLSNTKSWKFIIEIPNTNKHTMNIKQNFDNILPLMSIIASNSIDEVTRENYQLFIGDEEELVARFLEAYENGTIDRLLVVVSKEIEIPVDFDKLSNLDECRQHIYDCMDKYVPELPRNKIYEISFVKFLYRRIRFFTGYFYRFNMSIQNLGSLAMKQMIHEAKHLTQIDFRHENYLRTYLVYDPNFSLQLLYDDWNNVSDELKQLFNYNEPKRNKEYQNRNYLVVCLSWLLNIKYETFEKIMNDTKFILTESFAYKLFHIHERKLTKLPLIIEGETGVGKTFLLLFYSSLLNANIINGSLEDNISPRIRERTSIWLLHNVIIGIFENEPNLLGTILRQIKQKLNDDQETNETAAHPLDLADEPRIEIENDKNEGDNEHTSHESMQIQLENTDPRHIHADENDQEIDVMPLASLLPAVPQRRLTDFIDTEFLNTIKHALYTCKYDNNILQYIWKTIITISSENQMNITEKLIIALHNYITTQLTTLPLIEISCSLKHLLSEPHSSSVHISIRMFNEYLCYTQVKPVFYRLLLHPGVTEEQLEEFMSPIIQLARELHGIELIVFFDEINTSSCLGLFKEMFMDRTLHGKNLPENIFFTAAINPSSTPASTDNLVHRLDYIVHQLPQALEGLIVSYGILESKTLGSYIRSKIAMFDVRSSNNLEARMPLEHFAQDILCQLILAAQDFCEIRLGKNTVSQREIQRCFNLIDFFWKMRYDDETNASYQPNPIRCITLSIALTYYFRLPTEEDNRQRNDHHTPTREELGNLLSDIIPDFLEIIQFELEKFVNADNFVIPHGVAINQAVREHLFAIVVSVVTRTPLCIIGAPGQSKTLSFQIALQNLQGPQLSTKQFCKRLPSVDPFFCLGSKYSRSEDIAYVFDRAIQREQQYKQYRMNTRCVVFLDEASLPDEKKMILKVLHPYLDECKVSFIAVANKSFDAANSNRMICIYRSRPSEFDQKILAYGCLGLDIKTEEQMIDSHIGGIVQGLCQGYREVLMSPDIPPIFHDRDFIYMLRELRFELTKNSADHNISTDGITPASLLRALEDNFNGINEQQFKKLVEIFYAAVQKECDKFLLASNELDKIIYRNVPTIMRESMGLESVRRRLYGRYKLIIDESEDESAVHFLFQSGLISSDPKRTTVFRMSDFAEDINNELRNTEILSNIKLCMETGKTILMVNTERIHGSLYDVFNQNFSIMATDDTRKIFSKVAIGPKTIDVVVHEDFQCIIHVKRNEVKHTPAPFLSRFQKYSLSVKDFYRIQLECLVENEQTIIKNVEEKVQSFIQHFGRQYFYGLNENTLYSCLLSLIKINGNEQYYLSNPNQHYSQLTIKSKSFIEKNPTDLQQCLVRLILSQLIQLVSPESIILKLPTLEDSIAQSLCTNYFQQQEHFNIENFIRELISKPCIGVDNSELWENPTDESRTETNIIITKKVMIFTRTSSYLDGLNEQTKSEFFNNDDFTGYDGNLTDKIDVLNLASIENSVKLQHGFHDFGHDEQKAILIIVIDAQQSHHIPFLRQLIDHVHYTYNADTQKQEKYFLMLIHSPARQLYHQFCFASIFLNDWDFYFFDTYISGSSLHLQKMLQILSPPSEQQEESYDNILLDLNTTFDDCLWDFCSKIQIFVQELPQAAFKDKRAYQFYQRGTSVTRRVQCLKQILHQSTQLQKHIVNIYHEYLSKQKDSRHRIYEMIYRISKDIICGKRFEGLIESIHSYTRVSFTRFVSNILKVIINNYGLDALLKLSTNQSGFNSLLKLIDYSSFTAEDESANVLTSPLDHRTFQIVTQYSCIAETPFYHLFHQRVRAHVEDIKLKHISKLNENKEQDIIARQRHDVTRRVTTVDNTDYELNETVILSAEQFRSKLVTSILNDTTLAETITEHVLNSYLNDLVRTFCLVLEKQFPDDHAQSEKVIGFIAQWIQLVDDDDLQLLQSSANQNIFLLAYAFTMVEYVQNDVLSLYSACRIINRLNPTESFQIDLFNKNGSNRSRVREELLRHMFDLLWKSLREICLNDNENSETWIQSYVFISKYYPSDKILGQIQLITIKSELELMNLAYLIFLNEKISHPKELVSCLLDLLNSHGNENNLNYSTSHFFKLLPDIIETIHKYFVDKNENESTLMIDLQQWIISTLKTDTQSCKDEINYLFKYLNQSLCHWSLPMKQFAFDQLANLSVQGVQQNRPTTTQIKNNFFDRLKLFSTIVECFSDDNRLQNYQLPYHPIVIDNRKIQERPILIDLFFFHLKRHANDATIDTKLIKKLMLLEMPTINSLHPLPSASNIFQQFKGYFSLHFTGLLLCDTNLNPDDTRKLMNMVKTLIDQYLSIEEPIVQFSPHLQLFLATIVSKHSWSFLVDLLNSDRIRNVNNQWANHLHRLLESKEPVRLKKDLQRCHQLQFTVASKPDISSIFPHLHLFYDELCKIIENCVIDDTPEERWKPLSDWIETRLNSDPKQLKSNEIKAMLLLNIYYNYYCSNHLASVQPLLEIVNDALEPLPEDLKVFRALLQPEQHIIGYTQENVNEDVNCLNRLFKLDSNEEDELAIRHCLVNLMVMILMGGKQSFLWTFAFEPLTLENTFGFGSTTHFVIQKNGIHYDCGCVLTLNGDLTRFPSRENHSVMNVPAVYTVLFSTFGAMAWNLLLFDESVENLHGPILSPTAIDDNTIDVRIAGDNLRTKVCHFVRARLLSTFNFLSIRSNPDETCILLGRCFEQMAFLTINEQDSWIKPIYSTLDDELSAEAKYESEVFFLAFQKVTKHKTYINQLQLQSEIQTSLHQFVTQMPMTIHFSHFQVELCNPMHSSLPLKLLRHILDSVDILKMTKYIPDLSRFYLLLHQTYTQLIESEEFINITMQELYNRAQKLFVSSHHQHYPNETNNHYTIISKGIEAINAYHKFTDGLIRPGACDETQRFSTVSHDTPVHHFVTTENHDEGDITMRILSVLVDYHNSLLDLIEQTMSSDTNHGVGILKILTNELISREVSVLIIASNNNGFITLTDDDFSWIEELCRASLLVDDEYFPKFDTQFTVDFMYLQSYIIRTYLLRCHINYRQIAQKYQCYVRQIQHTNTTENTEILDLGENYGILLDERQLETDWKHLKLMYLDKLYHGHNFLRQIATILRHNTDDFSSKGLYEFLESEGIDENDHLREQLERYEIRNFQLCYIDHVRRIYEKSIGGFQYLFTDVPHLLHTSIDEQSRNELSQIFESVFNLTNEDLQIDELQSIVQQITAFSNELKAIENTLLQQSAKSLREICEFVAVENPILQLIPNTIKCEHYVSLNIYLIQLRSILQERTINIQERERKIWSENLDLQCDNQQQTKEVNRYQVYLNPTTTVDNNQTGNEIDEWPLLLTETDKLTDIDKDKGRNTIDPEPEPVEIEPAPIIERVISSVYRSLFKLKIQFVPLTYSTLIQKLHEQEHPILSTLATKAQKYSLKYPDGRKPSSHLCKSEKLFENLKKAFSENRYDPETFAVIDQSQIVIDFINAGNRVPRSMSPEYSIIERTHLVDLRIHFRTNLFKYSTTSTCEILAIINRFTEESQLEITSSDTRLCFFDEVGKCIDDKTVGDIDRTENNSTVNIYVKEEDNTISVLSQITVQLKEDQHHTNLFSSATTWQQINRWIKTLIVDESIDNYIIWDPEQKIVVDENHPISSAHDQTTFDGISENETTKVTFLYETNQQLICTLKSTPIFRLLNNEQLLRQLEVKISPKNCVLMLNEINNQLLMQNDMQQPLSDYLNIDYEPICFRIVILIIILKYDDQKSLQIPISNRNLTVSQLLEKTGMPTDVYKYLALNETFEIISNNQSLSDSNEVNFILVKDNETCIVEIEKNQEVLLVNLENEKIQKQYVICATIAHVCKSNNIDMSYQYLLYSDDFVPSIDTSLASFRSGMLHFKVIDNNLPISIKISNDEEKQSTTIHCSRSITIKRLCQIVCQLFGVNDLYYELNDGESELDGDLSLDDIDSSKIEYELTLNCKAALKSKITYGDHTIMLPCNESTLLSTIMKEICGRFQILESCHSMYRLILMNDDQTQTDWDDAIDDVLGQFPDGTTVIPFQLEKLNE